MGRTLLNFSLVSSLQITAIIAVSYSELYNSSFCHWNPHVNIKSIMQVHAHLVGGFGSQQGRPWFDSQKSEILKLIPIAALQGCRSPRRSFLGSVVPLWCSCLDVGEFAARQGMGWVADRMPLQACNGWFVFGVSVLSCNSSSPPSSPGQSACIVHQKNKKINLARELLIQTKLQMVN